MEKTRKILREQRLQKYSRILSNRYKIQLIVKEMKEYGYCNTANKIWIREDIDKDEIRNLILQKGITLHELGHILFTSSKEWVDIDKNLANVISDGRVEEGVARLFSKARMYFIFLNQVILGKFEREPMNTERYTMELIFREAKRTTGLARLPDDIHQLLKKELKDDYDWFLTQTRLAVDSSTEKESAEITLKIENKLKEIFNKPYFDSLPSVQSVSGSGSISSSGASSRKMPKLTQEDKTVIEQIEKLNKEDSEDGSVAEKNKDGDKTTSGSGTGFSEEDADGEETDEHGFGDSEEYKDDEIEDNSSNGLLGAIEKNITNEVLRELRNETDIITAGNIKGDFGTYDTGKGTPGAGAGYYGKSLNPIDTPPLEPISNRMAHAFKIIAQSGKNWNHNQTRGKLEMHKITTLLQSAEQPRVFKRKIKKEKTDLSVAILVDASGSMQSKCVNATKSAYIIARALEIGRFNTEVIQFGVRGYQYNKQVYGVKAFNQKLVYAKNNFRPLALGGTPLLPALKGAEQSLAKQDSKRKVVIVVTDGAPDNVQGCKQKINEMEKKGIAVIGILVGWYRSNLFVQDRGIQCEDVTKLPVQMQGIIKNILHHSKGVN